MTLRVEPADLEQTIAPLAEPVSLAEAKQHLRVDYDDDDALIATQIAAARGWIEKELNISMVQRTYRAYLPQFADEINLPRPPFASLTSVQYWSDESPQALTTVAGLYEADLRQGRLLRAYGEVYPSTAPRHDAVQITFVAGYAPDSNSPINHAANVPAELRAALLLILGDLYENRESSTPIKIEQMPTVKLLMNLHRQYR